jgi:hypothetical protein
MILKSKSGQLGTIIGIIIGIIILIILFSTGLIALMFSYLTNTLGVVGFFLAVLIIVLIIIKIFR